MGPIPALVLACATFVPEGSGSHPSLAVERVLVAYDEPKGVEHFVREAVFDDAGRAFAFVVPVPSRPEVAAVENEPFTVLERAFPFARPEPRRRELAPPRAAPSRGLMPSAVTVLEQKMVGHFRAFVLTATGADGLDAWLAQNGFASGPSERAWIAPYVEKGWFFVALKPDGRAPAGGRYSSEPLRISFATPVPFYPYREPPQASGRSPRVLALWFLTNGAVRTPLATDESRTLVRPWHAGLSYPINARTPITLESPLRASWMPRGTLRVQTFEDQKPHRGAFSDTWLVAKSLPLPGELRVNEASVAPALAPERSTPDGAPFDTKLRERLQQRR